MRVRAAAVIGMMMACAAARGQQTAAPLSLADATTAALRQVSAFHQAQLDEAVAAEELRQARSALLPRARDSFTVTYNSPSRPRTVPPTPSFISADAIHVYQNLLGVTGELGVGLAAAVQRGHALLEAARAGTEVARRALVRGVGESYYGAALASARRGAAEGSLAAAEEFERVTELNFRAGEVPEVDVIRARLQTAARRDELLQARQAEAQANAMLSTLLGRDLAGAAAAIEPLPQVADARELDALTAAGVARRPELAQAAAQVRAARADVGVARGERLPRITYSVDRGFDTDSLQADALREHRGLLATANVDVPVFDWGASRSRQRAAELKLQAAQQEQQLTQRELALDFVTARQEAETAAARVANARNALADAERNESISVARYRAGEAPISEATDAQTTLAQQRLALQQALFDYQVARAHLREAAGE